MGVRNYLIEGVSGAGKTTVAEALQRRGFQVFGESHQRQRRSHSAKRMNSVVSPTWVPSPCTDEKISTSWTDGPKA